MAASPPTGTRNDVLLTSDSLFVPQNHRSPHGNEAQHRQSIFQGSGSPAEPFPAQLPSNQQPDKPAMLKEPSSFSTFTSTLLSRPIFKALELKQGFEYGPPIPIAPDQFTRRLCSPAPINQPVPQQEQLNHTKLPTPAAKQLSPKRFGIAPQRNGNPTSQHMSPPPPRPHAEPRLLHVQPTTSIPSELGSLRLPVKRKNDHVQSMAPPPLPPFPRSPQAQTRRQAKDVDHRAPPMRPQLEEPSTLPTDPQEIPTGRDINEREPLMCPSRGVQERTWPHSRQSLQERPGQREPELGPSRESQERTRPHSRQSIDETPGQREPEFGSARGGRETTRPHSRQSLHEIQATNYERPKNPEKSGRHQSRGHPANLDSDERQHQNPHTDTSYGRQKNPEQPERRHSRGHVNSGPASVDSNGRQRRNPDTDTPAESPGERHPRTILPQNTTTRGQRSDDIPIREDEPTFRDSLVLKQKPTGHVPRHTPSGGLATSDLSESLTSSPALQATRNTHEFSTSMARAINHFNISQKSELERQKEHYKRKLRAFQRKVEKQAEALGRLEKRLLAEVKEHQSAKETNHILTDRNKKLDSQLELKEAELQSLTLSFDDFQDQSAKASDGKQRLLDQFEKRNGELTKEVQALKSSLKLARDDAEKWEAHAQDADRRVKLEEVSREEAYNQLDHIKLELSDLEHALELERAKSAGLEEKVEDLKAAAKTTETLSAQYDEVIRRLEESNNEIKLEYQKCRDGSSSKLDTITEPLERLAKTLSAHSDTLSNIESHCLSGPDFGNINSKLEAIIEYQNSHSNESISPISQEIQDSLRKFQKQLDDREEVLRQKLEEKTKQNSMLSALSEQKDAELILCKAELETEKERSSCLEAERQELQDTLSLMDASQDQAVEAELQLEAVKNEVVRLQEEMASKDVQIKELKNGLDERLKAEQAATQEFSVHILQWTQRLQEKEEAHKVAIGRAEEVARREVRIEMEREIDNVKKLQHQTAQQRDALSERIEKLNEDLARNEESKRDNATTIASLRKAVTDLENQCTRVTQEKSVQESLFKQAKAQDAERLEALNTEIETMKTEVAESRQQTRSQITKSQRFLAALRQLAEQQGLSSSIVDDLESVFEGRMASGDIISRIAQAVDQFIGTQTSRAMVDGIRSQPPSLLKRSPEFFPNLISLLSKARLADDLQSQRYPAGQFNSPANTNSPTNETGNNAIAVNQAARLLAEERRVVVRSPVDFQLEPSPPSITQEKTRRRQGPQPKSIMKPITRSMANQFWSPVVPDPESLLRNGHRDELEMYELSNVPTSAQHRDTPPANSPPSTIRANENTNLQDTGSRSRKRGSESGTGTAQSTTRRKRSKKGDQGDTQSIVPQHPPAQETMSGSRLKENMAASNPHHANKAKALFQSRAGDIEEDEIVDDDDTPLLPRRVSRGNKNSAHTKSGTSGKGEDINKGPSTFGQPFSQTHVSPTSMAAAQRSQVESQEDTQSSYWPPKTGSQDTFDFLTGSGQTQADPFRFSPDLL
ncbi:hypothetical protein V8F20_002173 [Naviculisporaceae sp. PSN 640]